MSSNSVLNVWSEIRLIRVQLNLNVHIGGESSKPAFIIRFQQLYQVPDSH